MRVTLKTSLFIGTMTAALMVGGCGKKDKGQGALKSAEVQALNLSRADASTFAPYFETGACAVDEMEALGALAGLGLGETGADGMAYDARTFDAGTVTYTDWRMTRDNDVMSIDTLSFYCPTLTEGGDATFARMDAKALSLTGEPGKVSAATLNIADVTPEAAQGFVDMLTAFGDDMDSEALFNVGAMSVTDMKVNADGVEGGIKGMAFGIDRDANKVDAMGDSFTFTMSDDDSPEMGTVNFNLDSFSMKQADLGQFSTESDPSKALTQAMQNINVLEKPYDSIALDNMSITSDYVDMTFEGFEGESKERGDTIRVTQAAKPMVISLKPKLADMPQAAQVYNQLKALNFETMEFSSSSTTVIDKGDDTVTLEDGLLVMKDSFRMNFEYEMSGLAGMVRKAEAAEAAGVEQDVATLMETLNLNSMRFTLEDNSIVERGLKLASEMTGQSEDALKRNMAMLTMVAGMAGENELQSQVYGEAAGALVEWVKEGGTLTIEAAPTAPISIGQLIEGAGEGMDAKAVGFTARRDP